MDQIGGIDADVDVQVKQGDVTKVPAGQQHLDGVAAAAYATYTVPGEPAQAQLARLDTVLEAVIGGFADKPSCRRPADRRARPVVPVQPAARAARDRDGALARSGRHGHARLPLPPRARPQFRHRRRDVHRGHRRRCGADQRPHWQRRRQRGRARAASAPWFATGSAPPGSEQRHGQSSTRRETCTGNQKASDSDETVILITEDSPEQRALGEKVAAALGVGVSALRVSGEGQSIADVVVVLGTDYRP